MEIQRMRAKMGLDLIRREIDDDKLFEEVVIKGIFKAKSLDEYVINIINHIGWEKYYGIGIKLLYAEGVIELIQSDL